MIRVQSDDGTVACVEIFGQIGGIAGLPVEDMLEDVLGVSWPGRRILLDLSGLHTIDSSGLCWLLRQQRRIREEGGQLVLHSASSTLCQTLSRLKLGLVFSIARDRETALRLAASHGRACDSAADALSQAASRATQI